MNQEEYISLLEKDIGLLLKDYFLNNYKNQIFAWRLNASFTRTYKEDYLFNRALFLSTNSSILIQNNGDKKLAILGLKECAEIYEYLSDLSDISDKYDKHYLLLLSAICYDLSGYQANGFCIANKLEKYILKSASGAINLTLDNIIIEQITLILLKKIPLANFALSSNKVEDQYGYILFKEAASSWYDFILRLNHTDYIREFDKLYRYFLNSGNIYLSHLIFLLKTRILLFDERSTWFNLQINEKIQSSVYWRKYVKLLSNDYYSKNSIKDINERKSIFEFWTSQIRAIENGLITSNENFVVQMPTSAGKTFIAELSILKYLVDIPSKKCIYIAPFRALTSEKEAELSIFFSKLGFSVSALSGSYEVDEFQDVILTDTDVLIATPEKIDLLLRLNPTFFNSVSFVVVDEGHIIGDLSSRATLLEFLIIRLRIKIPEIKTLFISAVMPPANADEYSIWLSGKKENVFRSLMFKDSKINEEWEPTRKLIGSFTWEGNNGKIKFKNIFTEDEQTKASQEAFIPYYLTDKEYSGIFPNKSNKLESTAALAYKLSNEGSTLVFCAQPRHTKLVYSRIKQLFECIPKFELPVWFNPNEDKESYHYAKIWYGKDYYITEAIKYGIGIHFGDMPEQVRNSVENDYRSGKLRILLSSNTVGQGLNFPIKNLVFYSLDVGFDTETIRQRYIQKRDFWNIVGRAGRAGKETEGKIIFVINTANDKRLFNEFTNRENIEEANSFVFKVLNAYFDKRINVNDSNFDDLISILSETYLLDMLSEEIIGSDYEKEIEALINNSLFKVQIDKRELDITPLKKSFRNIFKKFESHANIKQLQTYKITGFSFVSNKIVDDYIESKREDLKVIVSKDDYNVLIDYFLDLITNNSIGELKDYKLDSVTSKPTELSAIIKEWVSGKSINELLKIWESDKRVIQDFHILISKGCYYLYPWGII